MSLKDDKEKNQKEQSEEKLNKESRKDKTQDQPITNTGVAPDEHPKPNPGADADAASG